MGGIFDQLKASQKDAARVGSLVVGPGPGPGPGPDVARPTGRRAVPAWWKSFWSNASRVFPEMTEEDALDVVLAPRRRWEPYDLERSKAMAQLTTHRDNRKLREKSADLDWRPVASHGHPTRGPEPEKSHACEMCGVKMEERNMCEYWDGSAAKSRLRAEWMCDECDRRCVKTS